MSEELTREQWLAERQKGVGASEAGAIFGVSPWCTALQLYFQKLGMVEVQQTPIMEWGLRIEPVIADAYADRTGRQVVIPKKIMRHSSAPWMLASLDRLAIDGDGHRRVVEIKRVSQHAAKDWGEEGSADVPYHYFLQVQQQMAVADLSVADVAALIGDCDFRVYTIVRDDDIIDQLIDAERDFMRRVQEEDPPLPDWEHPTTANLLAMIEPELGRSIVLGDEVAEIVEQYQELGNVEKSIKTERNALKAKLLHAMDLAEIGYLPTGQIVTRKVVNRAAYQVKESSYVDLRIKTPKEKKASE